MVIKPSGVEVGRKERDGHWSRVRWLTSLPQGPSFSETSDGVVGMDTVVCYFECEPSSSTNLVRSSFLSLLRLGVLKGILLSHSRLSLPSHTPKSISIVPTQTVPVKCI